MEEQENNTPKLGGLLVVPAFALLATPVFSIVQFYNTCKSLNDDLLADPKFKMAFLLVNAALLLMSLYAAIQFFGCKKSAPAVFIVFALANVFCAFFLLRISSMQAENLSHWWNAAVVGAAIWCPYFLLSRRVRLTFVH